MTPLDKFILDQIETVFGEVEPIVFAAFQKHFGFPITDVKDTDNLERVTVEGYKGETFRYRGEDFLFMVVEGGEMDLTNHDVIRFNYSISHKEL